MMSLNLYLTILIGIIINWKSCKSQDFLRPTPDAGEGRTLPPAFDPGFDDDTCCGCIERSRDGGCPDDPVCEEAICGEVNPRCCRRWQNDCVSAALVICQNLDTCCGCLNIGNNGRCINDQECTNIICDVDPYCCNNQWDDICVVQANAVCQDEDIPYCCSCTSQTNFNGCLTDEICQNAICDVDPFCCGADENGQGTWDQLCVNRAIQVCQGVIPLPGTETSSTSSTFFPDNTINGGDTDNGGDTNNALQDEFNYNELPPFNGEFVRERR